MEPESEIFPSDRIRTQIETLDRLFGFAEPEVERIPPRPSNARYTASLPDGTEVWIGHNNEAFIFDPRTGSSRIIETVTTASSPSMMIIEEESSIIPSPPLVKYKNRNFFELVNLTA